MPQRHKITKFHKGYATTTLLLVNSSCFCAFVAKVDFSEWTH